VDELSSKFNKVDDRLKAIDEKLAQQHKKSDDDTLLNNLDNMA
jgi:Skp family chaperone for outer membrane proteins